MHESRLDYKKFTIPVEYAELPVDLKLTEIIPNEVTVTLSGPKRSFYLRNKEEIRLFLQLFNVQQGTRYINISRDDLIYPQDLSIVDIKPNQIKVTIEATDEEKK